MIISEKQIMHLIHIATEYRRELLHCKTNSSLSEHGEQALSETSMLLQTIFSQQPEELKVIE